MTFLWVLNVTVNTSDRFLHYLQYKFSKKKNVDLALIFVLLLLKMVILEDILIFYSVQYSYSIFFDITVNLL